MILVQIATALAIGVYVVLSKDAQPKRSNATSRESFRHSADHLLDRLTDSPRMNMLQSCPEPTPLRRCLFRQPLIPTSGYDSVTSGYSAEAKTRMAHRHPGARRPDRGDTSVATTTVC